MKTTLSAIVFLLSASAFAQNHCATYQAPGKERYLKAIEKVASLYDTSLEALCSSEKYLAIEAQPTHKIDREGNVIPHVSVQLHAEFDSCRFIIRDADLEVAEHKCYSGF